MKTNYTIEIQRRNVTPAQFLAYARRRLKATGGEIHCDPNAQSFPHAYGYRPDSTHFSVVRRPAGWYLVRVIRDTCGTSRGQLVLTDGAKADIIAAAETL